MKKLFALLVVFFIALPANAYPIGLKKFGHNYYGAGTDGAATISTNTTVTTVGNGDYGIKQYSSLTINSGKTLTVSNPCKGLIIYVQGNCDIEGSLIMDGMGGAITPPTEGVFFNRFIANAGTRGIVTAYTTAANGGAGGNTYSGASYGANNGSAGSSNQTGGGGSGAGQGTGGSGSGGAGTAGTCFSGGTGGGAGGYNSSAGTNGTAGTGNGGAGGNGGACQTGQLAGGGAGSPAGTGSAGALETLIPANIGTGGTLYLIVGGNLTLGSAGIVSANGMQGGGGIGSLTGDNVCGGGSSGGGRIVINYAGSLTETAGYTLEAAGAVGGPASGGSYNVTGGAGGNGVITGPTKIAGS